MDPQGMMAIAEAQRRRAGMGASGAGFPGGMPQTNTMAAGNPIAAMSAANSPLPTPSQGTGIPAGSNPSTGGIQALGQAKPGEAEQIVKALIDRLKSHPVPGAMPQ